MLAETPDSFSIDCYVIQSRVSSHVVQTCSVHCNT